MIQSAVFQFFLTLNDFLPATNKYKPFRYNFKGTPAIKDAIEAIGIPHTEVDFIIVNGSPVNFTFKLTNNDTVEVYPANANTPFVKSHSLSPTLNYPITFVADVQVGRLARALRILGFDTLYKNDFSDKFIVEIAEIEQRVVLTRDIGLLKHKSIKWGYWLRSQTVEKQLQEVVNRFNLLPEVSLFQRCLSCNGEIKKVEKESVLKELPPKTIQFFDDFFQCSRCKKIYWKGSHYEHMLEMVKRNLSMD
ncbi:Mut7-C RNAse domain-containing protein [Segetibacter koreensis]|uniref:Mut7-C RNAse domain-containing protein n=1 Tax=Segetibacter koreensis TaxID=398037 RepID=UPI00037ADDBD|nr:Mut7-C RNAse domain-containing protein [Segetibacter koreensis]